MKKDDFVIEALEIIIKMIAEDVNSEAKARLASKVLLKKWEKKDEA